MKGTMLVFPPDGPTTVTEFTAPIDLPSLKQALGGGYLETVPYFHSIMHRGELRRCVAFCDEDGKRKELPLNVLACAAWDAALRREPLFKYLPANKRPSAPDYLVGPVVVVFGDDEWMAEL
jgi:hypothetical protein